MHYLIQNYTILPKKEKFLRIQKSNVSILTINAQKNQFGNAHMDIHHMYNAKLVSIYAIGIVRYCTDRFAYPCCCFRYCIGVMPYCFLNIFWKWLWLEKQK